VFKGRVNLLRASISYGASDTTLVLNLDTAASALHPDKYKGFDQLVMFVSQLSSPSPAIQSLSICNNLIMHCDSSSDARRWNDAFSWVR
jgi:hypothetical protein